MAGGIYTSEKCPICGQKMRLDGNLQCFCCPTHKKQRTHLLFIKFGRDIKFRVSDPQKDPMVSYQMALQELQSMRKAVGDGTFDKRDKAAGKPLAFNKLALKYIEDREKDVSSGDLDRPTWVHIRADLTKCMETFGDTNVKELTFMNLRDFFRDLPLASKTKLNIRTNLSGFYSWLVSCRIIDQSQVPEIPTFKVQMGLRKLVGKSDQEMILDLIREKAEKCGNLRIYLAIKILATHVNLRPGDILVVQEKDVDLKEGIIWITDHKTVEHTQAPKYAPVTARELEMMKSLSRGIGSLPYFRFDTPMKGYEAGKPFGKKLLRKWWKRACAELGIEDVGLYGGTRHSTTRYLKQGMTIEEVKRQVGDRTTESFVRYCPVDLDELREGAEKAEGNGPPSDHPSRTTTSIKS